MMREQTIARYRRWLTEQAQRDRTQEMKEANEYVQLASRPLIVRNQKIRPFAPFNDHLSALKTFTLWQIIALLSMLVAFVAGLFLNFGVSLLVVAILFTFIYILYNLVLLLLSAGTFAWLTDIKIDDEIVKALADAEWPTYSILCPLYKESAVVQQLVDGLQRLDYPTEKLEIFLQVEEYDTETLAALQHIALPDHFHIVLLPPGRPRTKPRSCNYGLLKATGEYLVIYDAEDIPDPLQLKKAVLAFAESPANVACVQAKLSFYNSQQNLLTRWFTAEYATRYELTLPAFQRANLTIPLGGASNHFQTATLRKLGAWDIYNVTEDCDLGMRLAHYRFRTVILDSTTYEEANSQPGNWLRQRSRWIKGFMQTYLVYMRNPWQFVARKQWRDFVSLQFVLGCNVASSIAGICLYPLSACALLLWLIQKQHLFLLIVISCVAGLLTGNMLSLTGALLGCIKRQRRDLFAWIVLHPLYSFLLGIASLLAIYQIIVKPHYWEKTNHGLTAQATERPAHVKRSTHASAAPTPTHSGWRDPPRSECDRRPGQRGRLL